MHKPLTPTDHRQITLLKNDYKIVASILAHRLRPMMERRLKSTQYCGVPENSILDAVATVRDSIAHAGHTNTPLCILTLCLKNSFDRISHSYLFTILHSYGLSPSLINRIKNMYDGANSTVQINGHSHGPIPIRCGLRLGCPLSIGLYALCLQPLFKILESRLPGIQIGWSARPVSSFAYADDVTVFVTSVVDFSIIEEAIRLYEKASGARLNQHKSKVIAIGVWSAFDADLGIPYHSHVKFLGITFWTHIGKSINDTWARITTQLRQRAREANSRNICLIYRLRYFLTYLFAKIWYTSQIFPAQCTYTQRITSYATFFIWKGATFRVLVSTLQLHKIRGGWELVDEAATCRALLLARKYLQGTREGTTTASWLNAWGLIGSLANPSRASRCPTKRSYIRAYVIDMAYTKLPEQ